MSDITIKTYTTPCKSRSGNYSDGTTVVQSSGSVSYIGSGGSSVDIVKELGTDTLSDANVLSSLRTIKEITDRGHTHANKSALDNLTQSVIDNSHTHSNKAIIDGITSALVSDWNNAVHKSGDESITGTKTFDNLKCTTSEFTGLMKAASITLTDILTAATINAATINQNGNAVLDASNYTNYTYSQNTIGSLIDTAKTVAVNTAKESAASLYLPLSGGTMTGIITMPISYQIRWGDNTLMICGSNNRVNVTGLLYANTGIHTASLATSSTNLVTNLNADMLDGNHLSDILASNVASATKLQTARSIFGVSFDGTADCNGNASISGTLNVSGLATLNGGISTTNITADSLSVKSFTADISQTLAGSDYLTKSVSKLSENFVIPAVGSSVRVIVDDLEGFPSTACFASGDYIRFRAFNRTSGLTIADAWGTVVLDTTYGTNGYSNGTQAYTFTATSISNGAGLTVFKGSEVLDYGTSGNGLIKRTVLDSAGSPYMDIATWSSDPSNSANYTTHVRLGNLAGLSNCSGYGLYTDNAFLTNQLVVGDLTKTNNYLSYNTTDGLVIKGNLYVSSGAVASTSDVNTAKTDAISTAATDAASKYTTISTTNSLTTRVTSAETSITANSNAIALKASKTSVDSLTSRMTSAESSITQNANDITLRVTTDTYNSGLSSTLSSAKSYAVSGDSTTLSSAKSYTDTQISVTNGKITAAISTTETYADNAVSNLQIGGRNYLIGSNNPADKISNGYSNNLCKVSTSYTKDKAYTITLWADFGEGITSPFVVLYNSSYSNSVYFYLSKKSEGVWIGTATILYDNLVKALWYNNPKNTGNSSTIYKAKLELGTKSTDWTPAPEDVDASIATKVATTTYDAKMTLIDSQISSKVSQTDFNVLGQRVSSTESSITQLPNTIDARITTQVAANGSIYNAVASSLTMTTGGISLFGKTIQLAGATTFVSSLNSTAQGYATTAKTEAVAASLSNTTTAINNLNLSGRNLISQNFNNDGGVVSITHNYADGYKYTKATRANFESITMDELYETKIYLETAMEAGKTYILSFWYKCLGTTMLGLETDEINESGATTAWIFYSGTVTMGSAESRNYILIQQSEEDEADILISDVTLYEGTKYMGFNLSPEDVNDAMAKNFGYTDYSALNTAATAGTTIIKGGKINTALIEATAVLTTALAAHKITASDADITSLQAAIVTANYINSLSITTGNLTVTGGSHLGALTVQTDGSITNGSVLSISAAGKFTGSNVDITGKITATSGSIGSFSIDSYQLTATNGDDSLILNADLIRFLGTTSGVYIGADTYPSPNGGAILSPMRVEVNRSSASTAYGNMGSYYSVQGATSYDDAGLQYTGNNALYIVAGKICGSRFRLRRINTSQTLSKMDSFIITVNNSNTITITLPYGCEDGQWFEIKSDHNSSGNFIVAVPSGSSTTMYWAGSSSTSLTVSDGKTYKFVYDAVNDRWAVGISAL